MREITNARIYSFSLVDEPLLPEWTITLIDDDDPDD